MELVKNEKSKLQEASIRIVQALYDTGFLSGRDRHELIYRLEAGDTTAYVDLREILLVDLTIEMAQM